MMAEPIPTGARTWLDPSWRAEALAWATRILADLDRAVTGPADQRHVMPGSTAMMIPTDRGPVWFKASGPGAAHEGPLLEVFRRRRVAHVLLPLAVHSEQPWLLFEDGGTTMRQTRPDETGDHDLAAWERILHEYAALQRSLEAPDAVAEMLAAGAPDGRPDRLPDELERLLDDDRPWSRVLPEERDLADRARTRLRVTVPLIRSRATDLAASRIAATVQHDDLHGGNVLVGPAGDRLFDWGDAIVAHPFGTLTTTFNSIAHKTGLSLEDPAFLRLRDVYLEAWSGVLAADELVEVTALARDLACIGKSLAWERAFTDLEPDEMGDRGDSVAGWLMELAERLDEPRWGASTD